ncbi:MAG: glycoside hydrolase 100 family protein [Solirubrobacterales bacterium]
MPECTQPAIEEAVHAAHEVLSHNLHGPCEGLPRVAGWGYPEPYTRDVLISALAGLVTGRDDLMQSLKQVLEALARNQSSLGSIPSYAHDPNNLGASDTTPLFLVIVAIYRKVAGDAAFLEDAVQRALLWMEYRSSESRVIVDQQPTTDWRDEIWVPGYGLYVNMLVYIYLKLLGERDKAARLYDRMHRYAAVTNREPPLDGLRGLLLSDRPHFAFWAFKEFGSDRFDLMGNSLAILAGLAPRKLADDMIVWVESECQRLRQQRLLAVDLPPCLFPFLKPGDPDYSRRIERLNPPGCYGNGGVWPFVCGFYIAALVAAGRQELAEQKLVVLTDLVRHPKASELKFGFNEWHQAQNGLPKGNDWQSWSAALYVYAAECVRRGRTPFFEDVREP